MGFFRRLLTSLSFRAYYEGVFDIEYTSYQPWNHRYSMRGKLVASIGTPQFLRLTKGKKRITVDLKEGSNTGSEGDAEAYATLKEFSLTFFQKSPETKIRFDVKFEGRKRWYFIKDLRVKELTPDLLHPCSLTLEEILIHSHSSTRLLTGWIVPRDKFSITKVSIYSDSQELELVSGIERSDVAAQLPTSDAARFSGISVELPNDSKHNFIRIYCEVDGKYTVLCWEGSVEYLPKVFYEHPIGIHNLSDLKNDKIRNVVEGCFHDVASPYKKKLFGWIVDLKSSNAVNGVRVRFCDKIVEGKCTLPRPDVEKQHPNTAHSLNTGFEIAIQRVVGDPFMAFDYLNAEGKWVEFRFGFLSDFKAYRTLTQTIKEDTSGVKYRVDHAKVGRPYGYEYMIVGWCFRLDDQPIEAVRLKSNGSIFEAKIRRKRPDVRKEYGGEFSTAKRSGFEIPVTKLDLDGCLEFEYMLEGGDWILFAKESMDTVPFAQFLHYKYKWHNYDRWRKRYQHLISASEVVGEIIKQRLDYRPLISILMPTYDSDTKFLRKAVESVLEQKYERWELCISDDASEKSDTLDALAEIAELDPRIQIVYRENNGHISLATESAFQLSTGSWITFLDHDDELHSDALLRIVEAINEKPETQFIYSDEDKLTEEGEREDPFFKTDWDPYLLEGQNYVCHLNAMRRSLYLDAGGLREGVEGCQDWDLALRATSLIESAQIVHLPYVLYHWRITEGSTALDVHQKSYVRSASEMVLNDHILRNNLVGSLVPTPHHEWNIIREFRGGEVKVSIIIPTRNGLDLLSSCIESIYHFTHYRNFEILVIDNQSDDPETIEFLERHKSSTFRVQRYKKPFNFSAMNNLAAKKARGDVLVFLNNDITVQSPHWLHDMVVMALEEEVGAVGAQLLYPEGCMQHAGIVYGISGVAGHAFRYYPMGSAGQRNRLNLTRGVAAVTGACLAIRKDHFFSVGGFDEENLKVNFSDVDLGLKCMQAGLKNLMVPRAVLYHHESASRGGKLDTRLFEQEVEFFHRKWESLLREDPFYNPNLTLTFEDYSYRFPPTLGQERREQKDRVKRKQTVDALLNTDYLTGDDGDRERVA